MVDLILLLRWWSSITIGTPSQNSMASLTRATASFSIFVIFIFKRVQIYCLRNYKCDFWERIFLYYKNIFFWHICKVSCKLHALLVYIFTKCTVNITVSRNLQIVINYFNFILEKHNFKINYRKYLGNYILYLDLIWFSANFLKVENI